MPPPLPPSDPSRRVALRGSYNFRDVGGYPAAGGLRVAPGRYFRSDGLGQLDEASRETLTGLGIRTVIDLRETREGIHQPDRVENLGIDHRHIPALDDQYYPVSGESRITHRSTGASHLGDLYALMIARFGARLVEVVEALAADGAGPVVVHCSAGKDRTGLVTALTLDLLGVPDEWIVDDYAASETFLGPEFLAALRRNFAEAGIAADVRETATRSPRELMVTALTSLREAHGSVESYLLARGMDPGVPARLRAAYLQA